MWLSDGVLVEQYARLGFGLELTDLIDRELDRNQYFGLDLNTDAEGKIWAFPQGLQASAFFYNKSMFNEAGLSFPNEAWTLEDVRIMQKGSPATGQATVLPISLGFVRSIK